MLNENFEPYMSSGSSGLEYTCYACGEAASFSIKAVTESEEATQKILEMYDTLGLHAKAVKNGKWNDVELGSCPKHYKNLDKLDKICRATSRITPAIIVQSLLE